MALEILLHDLETILGNIQSDKVTIRTKALESLQQLFDDRSDEVNRVLASKQDVSWKTVYVSLHEAVKAQAIRLDDSRCTTTTKNRSGDYSNALLKCVNLANAKVQNIGHDVILESAFQAFADVSLQKHYALCYVQIVRKQVLNPRHNLAKVKVNQWSRKCCHSHLHRFITDIYSISTRRLQDLHHTFLDYTTKAKCPNYHCWSACHFSCSMAPSTRILIPILINICQTS